MYPCVYLILIITSISYLSTEGNDIIEENIANSLDGYSNSGNTDDDLINKAFNYGPIFVVYCNCTPGYCTFDRRLQRNVCTCPIGWYRVLSWMSSECKECNCGEGVNCKLEGFFDPTIRCICQDGYSSVDSKCKATCETNPCQNNGKCKVTADEAVECVCEPDFSGDFCQIKGCGKNICKNGGACRVLENVKYCQCLNGTRGDQCETVDGCDKLHCGENSLCSLNITSGEPYCACAKEGLSYDPRDKTCKETCANKNCQNGGICETVGDSKFCLCMAGTFGDHCGIVSECIGVQCGVDAKCQFDILTGNPFCKCKEGTLNYDLRDKKCKRSCYKEKCQNEGSCIFSGDYKFCQCKNGTSGDFCQTIVDVNVMTLTIGNENRILADEYDNHSRTFVSSTGEERIWNNLPYTIIGKPKCECICGYCEADKDGNMVCKCRPEWALFTRTSCRKCDCGEGANCTFELGFFSHTKYCICKEGYTDVDGTCKADCECKYGYCEANKDGQIICKCRPEWGLFTWTSCKKCDCGKGANCTFQLWFFSHTKYCICKEGYTDVDGTCKGSCSKNPCKNGGTCNLKGNDIVCTCKPPFLGEYCQINENDGCKPDTCQNGGTCKIVNNSKTCQCLAGTKGDSCELVDGCNKLRCGTESICTFNITTGNPFCACKEGLRYDSRDRSCKESCEEHDCQNGGICETAGDPKFCICMAGTFGDHCEILGVCKEFQCGEDAECQFDILTGNPFCKCKDKGLHYDPSDRKCKRSCYREKCQNEGICAFSGDFKFCKCKMGTNGDFCETTGALPSSEDN